MVHPAFNHPASDTPPRPEVVSVAHITLVAWQKRPAGVRVPQPEWITKLCRDFNLVAPEPTVSHNEDAAEQWQLRHDAAELLGVEFDFDSIDWSMWEELDMEARL